MLKSAFAQLFLREYFEKEGLNFCQALAPVSLNFNKSSNPANKVIVSEVIATEAILSLEISSAAILDYVI